MPVRPSRDAAHESTYRVRALGAVLRAEFVGLDDQIDWLLATLVAQENVLLVGPPGVAKGELATRTLTLLGLDQARGLDLAASRPDLLRSIEGHGSPARWWQERWDHDARTERYFHYLLSRFTQPEELFGPIEISLLRQGLLVRVNFGLLTGPGVRAAFLDEVFKASSAILNALLTLTQERMYFNWGGMVRSDIRFFIGASNELPGGFGSGRYGLGTGPEDFQTLHAFLDRFPIRLQVDAASGTDSPDAVSSNLALATDMAIGRERSRFVHGEAFSAQPVDMPDIDDMLRLAPCTVEHPADPEPGVFRRDALELFHRAFMSTAAALQQLGTTSGDDQRITWTISPRKLKALYKVALAHALLRVGSEAGPGPEDLRVFELIWDTPFAMADLRNRTAAQSNVHYGP